ncbi:hypothetical protein ACFOOK_06300 [Micromonospora krabiensis]|uniref:Uncharacterized protein n=1 Tax=Micromonospora krabiensis TaxID=307121 RepID=A0A1C3NCW2_9ACTN|nr:hypothetical protein [Micromonospora krabiensis]SBV30391.1 hypothetical protein GA0070620_5988 [Micromonospora krabiensis]
MTDLERRYLRLLGAYPADYRRSRGAEIVGTYLDLARPDQRWPSGADVADLVRGGLRQRLRAAGAADLLPGVRLAAVLAFLTATALATAWSLLELRPAPAGLGVPTAGPFVSLGIGVWVAWLLVAVVHALAPGRWARRAVASAVLLTVALVPAAALVDLPRPPLFVLVPQVALGLIALGLPDALPASLRAVPLIAVGVVAAAGTNLHLLPPGTFGGSYHGWTAVPVLPGAAVALLAVTLLLAAGLALRADHRGVWATLVLLTPIGLLALQPLAATVDGVGMTVAVWSELAATAVVIGVVGPALLPLALVLRGRRARAARRPAPCPTCGR